MELLFILLQVAIILLVSYTLAKVTDLRRQHADLLYQYEQEEIESLSDEPETEAESDVPTHVWEREKAFEARIARIKDELGSSHTPKAPTNADVLHPDVYNLPHDSIIDYEIQPPDVEYTK